MSSKSRGRRLPTAGKRSSSTTRGQVKEGPFGNKKLLGLSTEENEVDILSKLITKSPKATVFVS